MSLITPDKSRPMCLVVHVFCIEKVLSINEGCVTTMLWHTPAVSSCDQFCFKHVVYPMITCSMNVFRHACPIRSIYVLNYIRQVETHVLNCTHVLYWKYMRYKWEFYDYDALICLRCIERRPILWFIQWSLAPWLLLDMLAQSAASMCLITPDKSRPMCLTAHMFCIEKIWDINKGSMETVHSL